MQKLLARSFSLDLRALGLMRIATGIVILIDLGIRVTDLEAFYTDSGVTPVDIIRVCYANPLNFSFHLLNGSAAFQLVLFLIAGFSAFFLVIGYKTRLFTFLSWIFILSLHNRNPLILQGGDDLLRMTLFWALFLPWNKRYSVDQKLNPDVTPHSWFHLAGIAYTLQVCYVYFFSALIKGSEWSSEFTAMYYVFQLDQITYPTGQFLSNYPVLLQYLTASAYYFELLTPVMLLLPVKTKAFRIAGLTLIILFHLFNGSTILIGIFFIVGIANCIGLFPSVIMDRLERRLHSFMLFMTKVFLVIASPYRKLFEPTFFRIRIPGSGKFPHYFLPLVMLYVFCWNWCSCPFFSYRFSDEMSWPAHILRLDQSWGMFGPEVYKNDGWLVMAGKTKEDELIDLSRNGNKVSYDKPINVASSFKNDRWRKFTENYILPGNAVLHGYYCRFVLRKWNEQNETKKIRQLQIFYMKEFTLPDYRYRIPQKELLSECDDQALN